MFSYPLFTHKNSGCLMIAEFIKQPLMSRNNHALTWLQTRGHDCSH